MWGSYLNEPKTVPIPLSSSFPINVKVPFGYASKWV